MSHYQFIQSAFGAQCKVADERATNLKQFEVATPLNSSKNKASLASLVYDSFFNSIGLKGIQKMTNFSSQKPRICISSLSHLLHENGILGGNT